MAREPYFVLAVWLRSHTVKSIMKMTMHIDEDVLDRVMKITGAKTKRAAVEIALKDMARRHKMKELFSKDIGLTPDEWRDAFDPKSYPEASEKEAMVAEDEPPHGGTHPAR